jgi:hypothetical protein
MIRIKMMAMVIMTMATLRGEKYDDKSKNDSYDNNDNDDDAEG